MSGWRDLTLEGTSSDSGNTIIGAASKAPGSTIAEVVCEEKQEYAKKNWDTMIEVIRTWNIRGFWQLVREGERVGTMQSLVGEEDWYKYLSSIYKGAEAWSARHLGSAEAQSTDLDRGPRVFSPRTGDLPRDPLHPRSTGERGASGPGSASRLEPPITSKLRPAPLHGIGDGGTIPGLKNTQVAPGARGRWAASP
ncbi:hypothetical protein NDU88_001150 [Pleurodeles waltl]|uniref:Uncharacterized protein n=1 Tax=Pleurodeles waltl TaxID=8319 RepID=A0AAV7VYK9_PLEWA|nr:hypothetical protein NDU88_001150 [Pleurodeles waltl]